MDEAEDKDVENAIGKEFVKIGNSKVVANALDELNRVDVSKMSDEEIRAYSDTLESITWLRESLKEPEERRPNAKVRYEVTD